jgi:putative hemolysin
MREDQQHDAIFRIGGALPLPHPMTGWLERALALRRLESLYGELPEGMDEQAFLTEGLQRLGVSWRVSEADRSRIPREGPVVVVANHPYGGLEGMVMAALLGEVRGDVRLLANHLLGRVPEMERHIIGLDPFGGRQAHRRNAPALRRALDWLEDGGLLGCFPAGEVAHLRLRERSVADPAWFPTAARLARKAGATVIPMHFAGANSAWFQVLGLLHPRLRTALLPRELINKGEREIGVRIGDPIPPERLAALGSDQAVTHYLRLCTDLLPERPDGEPDGPATEAPAPVANPERIIEPQAHEHLAAEIAALPAEQCLTEQSGLQVFQARADQIPAVLREIGRLREITFRATGEGTGRAIDLDTYDGYYRHLFIWRPESGEVVGAYRLGASDEILPARGRKGLYSYSLFRYKKALIHGLSPALELGRSFVRPEYQRSPASLFLLWKGIGRFLSHNPRYRYLFGPVSISGAYRHRSHQLMVDFLRARAWDAGRARLVRPRTPFRAKRTGGAKAPLRGAVRDIEALSDLIGRIEPDGKGVPVLLRQYLKLGGRVAGFNVDPDFGQVLDGLIFVDLAETEPAVLARYMGREAAGDFRSRLAAARGEGLPRVS